MNTGCDWLRYHALSVKSEEKECTKQHHFLVHDERVEALTRSIQVKNHWKKDFRALLKCTDGKMVEK